MDRSTLIFPQAVDSLQADRGIIRGQLRDTYNRLHSIAADAEFISDEVSTAYPDFPVIPNQRAGAWYVKPTEETPRAYFKSTDGHTNEHDFNLRRVNLILLPVIKERKGIVLVDSTRRGKRFPDALSKTVPLWCATLNAARMKLVSPDPSNSSVSKEDWEKEGILYTSPQAVGPSEHAQIAKQIDKWAKDLANSAYDLEGLKTLDRPLRPFFVSPSSSLSRHVASDFSGCYPIICASASKLAEEADGMERARGFTYVQGSGDDHEAWSKGLTPKVFWDHADEILSASREEIDSIIARILDETLLSSNLASTSLSNPSSTASSTRIRKTRISLAFAVDPPTDQSPISLSVSVAATKTLPPPLSSEEPANPFDLMAKPGKAGYNTFFNNLEQTIELASAGIKEDQEVVILVRPSDTQSEANDLGVAVALILLVRLYDNDGALLPSLPTSISKDLVRSRLQWILEAFPSINPSRAVLNRVNEYLIRRTK
ncbi:tRNA A64-2'-O-ribosylphosphate transferase [Sporobolomyces salmoneus]|uniref:tRNA A64-2'-O-ribosylphosphate transferase n=1 Tax=Sporobolomyces salmoneus TaxID=183962 RepID=UPI003180A9DB